jgi:Zn-dependent protease with chaperone function
VDQLIYPRDRSLTIVTMVLGVAIWGVAAFALITLGGARSLLATAVTVLLLLVISFIAYLFARSAAIAHLMGNGVEVSEEQFPELNTQFVQCCDKLSIGKRPRIYMLNGNGVLNAYATWFLGRKYVVLLSSVVDAMDENLNGVRFYIGHELAHVIRHDNPILWALRWPALRFPLIGASFSRARESTCDRHGVACSESREGAARSLVALSAGAKRWKGVSLEGLNKQLSSARGFWMSFHELTARASSGKSRGCWNPGKCAKRRDHEPESGEHGSDGPFNAGHAHIHAND